MMAIPPFNLPPNQPPSRSSDSDKGRPKKEFRLPDKKKGGGEKEEKEKLFEYKKEREAVGEAQIQTQLSEQKLSQAEKAENISELSGLEAKQAAAKTAELIQKMILQLQVGTVGGKNFASIDLKDTADVPSFFANTNLTLTQSTDGLIVRFTNFESAQQQAKAIQAVEMHKEQLSQMMMNLQAKNIVIAELQIGTHSVTLPRIEPLPPPFRPSSSSQTESGKREQKQGREGEPPRKIEGI